MASISSYGIIQTQPPSLPQMQEADRKNELMSIQEGSKNQTILNNEVIVMDEGYLAWSQVFVAFLLVMNGFGYLSSFGLFQSFWMDALNRSASSISWIGSVQMFLLFFIGTLSGRAMDAGLFRWLLWCGCMLQILGTFSTASCGRFYLLVFSQGIVQGLGNGLLFTPAVALVLTYFDKQRTVALGMAASGAPIGGIIFPLVSQSSSY
jgi:MFS family permease